MLRVLFLLNGAYTVRAGYINSLKLVDERNGWESVYGVLEREKVDMDNADFGSSVFFECILE